jgi:hypothetical protein
MADRPQLVLNLELEMLHSFRAHHRCSLYDFLRLLTLLFLRRVIRVQSSILLPDFLNLDLFCVLYELTCVNLGRRRQQLGRRWRQFGVNPRERCNKLQMIVPWHSELTDSTTLLLFLAPKASMKVLKRDCSSGFTSSL